MQKTAKQTAEKIRTQYTEKQKTELDALRELDAKVKRPVNTFSYVFGSASALVMGTGMSLIMTDIAASVGLSGGAVLPGVIIGVVGMLMALVNYPIHKKMMKARRESYASEIFELSNKIVNQ